MEQCQEALSCSYYLFQRFPMKFKGVVGEDASLCEGISRVCSSTKQNLKRKRSQDFGCVIDCVSYFVNLIKQKSSPSEQVHVRNASAEAIVASGILEQAKLIGPLVSNHQISSETTPSQFQKACDVYAYQSLGTELQPFIFPVFGHWNEYFQIPISRKMGLQHR